MSEAPHVPAAFINAIAEEGTKAEAVEWLQKTWNELCQARAVSERMREDTKSTLLEAAACIETFVKHSERLRPYDNVTDAVATAERCRSIAMIGYDMVRAALSPSPTAGGPQAVTRQFVFNRYVDGRLMAQGARVYAPCERDALEKARKLFADGARPGEMEQTTFVLRGDTMEPAPFPEVEAETS